MFVFTTKLTKGKIIAAVLAVAAVICLIVALVPDREVTVYKGDEAMDVLAQMTGDPVTNPEEGAMYLDKLGWQTVGRATEVAEVIIPEEFDGVYVKYNEIQQNNGYNLEPYKGAVVKMYTYEVLNYPAPDDDVIVDILVFDDRVVGGDIHTIRIDGFMHGLCKRRDVEAAIRGEDVDVGAETDAADVDVASPADILDMGEAPEGGAE